MYFDTRVVEFVLQIMRLKYRYEMTPPSCSQIHATTLTEPLYYDSYWGGFH